MTVPIVPVLTLPAPARTMTQAVYAPTADRFASELTAMVPNMNTALNALNADIVIFNALAASTSTAASVAISTVGAIQFNAGTVYPLGGAAVSNVNFLLYRRTSAGSSASDPQADPANWVAAGVQPNVVVDVTTGITLIAGPQYRVTAACTPLLPATAARGDIVMIRKTGAFAVALNPNGHKIQGATGNHDIFAVNVDFYLTYISVALGWEIS